MNKLIGKQSKLDRNKNGKLDSQDFKMLRSGKKRKDEQFVDRVINILVERRLDERSPEARAKKEKKRDFEGALGTVVRKVPVADTADLKNKTNVRAGRAARKSAERTIAGDAGGGRLTGNKSQRKVNLDVRSLLGKNQNKIP